MKTQGNWVVEIGGLMSRIEVAVEICLMMSRSIQGCRADDNDDIPIISTSHTVSLYRSAYEAVQIRKCVVARSAGLP